jgi:hypothetical protein
MSSNNTSPSQLPSIFDLEPLEKGGEVARQGFVYQDHVGASFCLDMLELDELLQVWFETHDDIMLIWGNENEKIKVEFVQVKHVDRSSRWSVAALTARDKKTGESDGESRSQTATSLLEKSLSNSRCAEETFFRIVTSVDVADDLKILKQKPNGKTREVNKTEVASIVAAIKAKLGDIAAPDGTTIEQWTDHCFWDKRPETDELIKLQNLRHLENIAKKLHQLLYSDHRDELYQKLLALVSSAAAARFAEDRDAKRILQSEIRNWFYQRLIDLKHSGPASKTMQRKMTEARLPPDVIESAQELRTAYLTRRLDTDYVSGSGVKDAEYEVTALLQHELSRLDSGELQESGIEFHTRCLNRLESLAEASQFKSGSITLPFLQGYMYERTNRCVHRFVQAQP